MYHDRNEEKPILRTLHLRDSDLLALSRLLKNLVGEQQLGSDSMSGPNPSPGSADADQAASAAMLLALAHKIIRARGRRSKVLGKAMFGEPAWDMLLVLYVSTFEGPRLSVGRLTALSSAPPTTALRWLDYLEKERLVRREANPTDKRSEFVELTEKAHSIMEQYLSETLETPA